MSFLSASLFSDIWESPGAKAVIGVALIAIVGVILFYAISHFRGMAIGDDTTSPLDDLSDFRRMRDEGRIGEKDFQRLKSELSQRVASATIADEGAVGTENKGAVATDKRDYDTEPASPGDAADADSPVFTEQDSESDGDAAGR